MKAISLFSGGLDSQLAVCIVRSCGIEVEAVNFKTPFFGGSLKITEAADRLGIPIKTIDISDEYMDLLRKPRYGFGKNMNPCIDCHGFMLSKAGDYMTETGAGFIITGEVLGQRPMSQNTSSLNVVEKLSGYPGLILRPLSAKLLKPTIPEIEGWIDRDMLLDIQGRSRARQMELAKKYNLVDYPSPAGGCLLTMESYSRRLRRYLQIMPEASARAIEILRAGRHFYLNGKALLVVGRNKEENAELLSLAQTGDYLLKVLDFPGPTALLRLFAPLDKENWEWAAALTARYSDGATSTNLTVKIWQPDGMESLLSIKPMTPDQVPLPV